jgi:hypothetical protein
MFDEPEETGSGAGGPANKSGGARDRARRVGAIKIIGGSLARLSSTALAACRSGVSDHSVSSGRDRRRWRRWRGTADELELSKVLTGLIA